jgi:hypothetical protein
LRARETVPMETPLRRANCRIVTLSSLISENGFGTVSRQYSEVTQSCQGMRQTLVCVAD